MRLILISFIVFLKGCASAAVVHSCLSQDKNALNDIVSTLTVTIEYDGKVISDSITYTCSAVSNKCRGGDWSIDWEQEIEKKYLRFQLADLGELYFPVPNCFHTNRYFNVNQQKPIFGYSYIEIDGDKVEIKPEDLLKPQFKKLTGVQMVEYKLVQNAL